MFHCALRPRSPQRWCVWQSGTGCPPSSFCGRFCQAAWHSPPGRGRRKDSIKTASSSAHLTRVWHSCTYVWDDRETHPQSSDFTANVANTAARVLWIETDVCFIYLTLDLILECAWRFAAGAPVAVQCGNVANHCSQTRGYLWQSDVLHRQLSFQPRLNYQH